MPVPIMPIPDNRREDKVSRDYSILLNVSPSLPPKKKTVQASNSDATLLFEIWTKGEKSSNEDSVKISSVMNISSKDIMRLKTMGFLTGGIDEVQFTRRGKIVITTMALGEVNNFEKNRQPKSYTEILASMNKRGKKGFRIPAYSANTSNNLRLK